MRRRRFLRRKTNPLDYISFSDFDLDPQIKRGIFIIFILAVGAVSLLSLFDLAGIVGVYLAKWLSFLFGYGRWAFSLFLLLFGFMLYKEKSQGANYFGLFLFFISLETIFHFFLAEKEWQSAAEEGLGGGYLGFYLATIFVKLLGFWGGLIIIFALVLASLMLIFNASLSNLIGRESWPAKLLLHPFKFLFNKIFNGEEKEEELEEEPEEDFIEDSENKEYDFLEAEEEENFSPEFKEKKLRKAQAKKIIEPEDRGWKKSNIKIDLPLDLLADKGGKPTSGNIKNNIDIIKRTLENFGIPVEMGEVSVGPTVTQYTFKPAEGIKLSRITALSNDLALALAAHPIRIEAPIPGKSLVGIEVPNQIKAIVGLKEILSDKQFKERKNNLMIALGKDVAGNAWIYDLSRMPHILVAGATNSGKSVCLNSIVLSLLYQNNPDDLKFIMVDPKRVELPVYNGLPHLLTPVITEVGKTVNALKWCLNEMDKRFELLSQKGKRNIQGYNAGLKNGDDKMPCIVFIIDELADLMVAAARDVEPGIIRLAQMARAVGIYLILATQRPSVDVITGLIKANTPARIAFSVASGVDSRTIIDSLGAEKLLGRGDMLFTTAELSKPKRLQGAFVGDEEIKRVIGYIKERSAGPNYIEGVTDKQKVHGIAGVGLNGTTSDSGDGDEDELLEEAKELIINSGKASASYLQRKLSIGYARAARLLDLLEEAGVIGPVDGAKRREILITKEQYDNIINQGVSGVKLHKQEEFEEPDEFLSPISSESENNAEDDESEEKNKESDDEDDGGKYFLR
jgi:S-DNA-T family DNA segregation ATPase FtsK/SpoIIIE